MESDIKVIQTKMLEIMTVIDQICADNNISYTLAWGTALGAVRHKGFIPWDNDADISMLYDDYIKFVKLCGEKGVLPEGYILQTHDTDRKYPFLFAKIRDINTNVKEKCFEGMGMQEGVWVDVFPVINMSEIKLIEKMQKKLIVSGDRLCHKYYFLNNNDFVNQHNNHLRLKRLIFRCIPDIFINFYAKTVMRVCSLKNSKKSKYVCNITSMHKFKKMPRHIYKSYSYMPFQDTHFKVTDDFDEYLTIAYGDYMTPVKYSHGLLE